MPDSCREFYRGQKVYDFHRIFDLVSCVSSGSNLCQTYDKQTCVLVIVIVIVDVNNTNM